MLKKSTSMLGIVFLLSGQALALSAGDDMGLSLSRVDRLIIPAGQQCARAEPAAIAGDFEGSGD